MINNEFKEKINIIRKRLLLDENSILFAQINEPLENNCTDFEITQEHKEILKLFNGARFGSIDLFNYDIVKKQNTEEHWEQINNHYRVLSGNLNLCVIGQILYRPVFIDKKTKKYM